MNELLTTLFWSAVTLAAFFGWRRIFLAIKNSPPDPLGDLGRGACSGN
jgi:hypothetical protein